MYIQQKWLIFHYKLIIGNFDYNKCSKWPPFDLIHNSALLLMLPTQLLMKSGLKLSKKSSTTFFNLGMVEGWASQTFCILCPQNVKSKGFKSKRRVRKSGKFQNKFDQKWLLRKLYLDNGNYWYELSNSPYSSWC